MGTGGAMRPFAAFGVDRERYVARFTEGVAVMKALWTEPRVTFDGEFWQLRDAAMEPKPFQKPYPPLWFGGSGPAALRRAVRDGDGFFGAGSTPTAKFAEQVQLVRRALGESGRSVAGFPIAKRVYVTIDENPARARSRTNEALARCWRPRCLHMIRQCSVCTLWQVLVLTVSVARMWVSGMARLGGCRFGLVG